MFIMKVVHNNEIELVRELQELRELLKKKNITIGLVESKEGSSHLVKIMCDEEGYSEKVKRMIYLYISNILYNIVIEKYRKKELFNFLTETYFFLKQEEILEVEEMIMKVLRSEENLKDEKMIFCISKINSIIEKIKTCLEENEEINIQGFITFRMKELREDIEEIIDKVVEEYMVEKEYKEFVKLLKYFVDIQESRIDEINIYIQGDNKMSNKISRKDRKLKFETLQLHVGQESPDPVTDARAVPIYQTSSYVFKNCDHAAARFGLSDAGNIYGRLTNPTEDVFEQRMAALEGGVAALAVASGAAALSYTFQNLAQSGDHIVAANNIYGGTYNYLEHTFPEYGVKTTFVDPSDLKSIEDAIQENTKAVFIETLGNPNSDVVDIEAIAKIAHENKIPLVIDNTFGTPYLIRPIEHGADIVVHSATKFIGGHGTTIGGVIVDGGKFDWEASGKFQSLVDPNPSYHGVSFTKAVGPAAFVTKIRAILLRDTGATLSPFHAFLFLQGLETLSLRVERHVENALKVVEYLNNHPQVEKVHHPSITDDPEQQRLYKKYFPNGAGSIFTFEIKGDAQKAKDFIDNLELFSLLANVADVKSLVIHPASTTHSQLNEEELLEQGIKPNTIRLSIGTEHIDDIIQDLEEAFKSVK